MATIKSYSGLEQSKKLAEILPIESADMCCFQNPNGGINYYGFPFLQGNKASNPIPCWSLAALLNLLPNEIVTDNRFECHYQIDIRKYDGGDKTTLYQIAYGNNRGSSGSWHDMINTGEKESLIDCCVQMITKLKERNLI